MDRKLTFALVLAGCAAFCTEAQGQTSLCGGSLGDPKINIDFGSGSGFGPALETGVTTYQYVPAAIEHDGQYTLASNVNDAKPDWHVLEDHTPGDNDGYMLVVNADEEPGEFYRARVSDLCKNTTFEFSAWITNANTPPTCAGQAKRPNVLFRIEDLDGTILGSVATGDIQPSEIPQWGNYGFTFDTGEKTEFYLVMVNNNEGGCGNDLAIDDITFRACGPPLLINAEGYSNEAMPFVCPGAVVDLKSAIGTGFPDPVYQWQVSDNDGVNWVDIAGKTSHVLAGITASATRSYRVVAAANLPNLASPFCRVVSNPLKVTVVPPLSISQQPGDLTACLNEQPFFEVVASGGYPEPEYHWESSPGPGGPWTPVAGASDPRFYPAITAAGEYYYRCVLGTSAPGCAPLPSRTAKLKVLPPLVTLELTATEICADAPPLALSGGKPAQTGVYSGKGVVNGRFDPAAAGGPGTYEITYSLPNISGCQYVATDLITVHPAVTAEAGSDKKMLEGTWVVLEGKGSGASFSWSPAEGLDDPHSPSPRASPLKSTVYTLTVTTDAGCSASDEVYVEVLDKLIIPSAFTPNSDGVNDTWKIEGISGYPEAIVKVFNRWGETIYQSRSYGIPWDGTVSGGLLPAGVYYYFIIPGIFLGPISGAVTIIR